MKKVLTFVFLPLLIISGLVLLFYFYLPSLEEPEGLSLEVKTEVEVKNDLGYVPVVTSQTVFLPEPKDQTALEEEQSEVQQQLIDQLAQEAEAAWRSRKQAPIPANFQKLAGKVIEVNLSQQQLIRWENGTMKDVKKVSTGKRTMPTPTGVFKIRNKIPLAYSRRYRLYMPYWMAFTSAGHGIHELPIFRNGRREGANHLGRPVSHGCVRLGVGDAKEVYAWAVVGTPVVIHY